MTMPTSAPSRATRPDRAVGGQGAAQDERGRQHDQVALDGEVAEQPPQAHAGRAARLPGVGVGAAGEQQHELDDRRRDDAGRDQAVPPPGHRHRHRARTRLNCHEGGAQVLVRHPAVLKGPTSAREDPPGGDPGGLP